VAFNYRGILNLDATTINTPLDATLRAVTDGMGTASPLQLSTTQVALSASNPVFLLNGTNAAGAARNWGIALNQSVNGDFAISYSSANGTTALANEALVIKNTGSINIGGTFTNAARLHVRGDGTNPIARFENNAGALAISVNNSGQISWAGADYLELLPSGRNIFTNGVFNFFGTWTNTGNYIWQLAPTNSVLATSGTHGFLNIIGSSFAAAAGSANFRPINIAYTINNSGAQTGNATGLFLNATETALNGITHNLMDLQVGGVSIFRLTNTGTITTGLSKNLTIGADNLTGTVLKLRHASDQYGFADISMATIVDNTFNRFEINRGTTNILRVSSNLLVQFGGYTNAFPAIKRNGAAIDFRLADDSGYCAINVLQANFGGLEIVSGSVIVHPTQDIRIVTPTASKGVVISSDYSTISSASAFLEVKSTTKGFLPPRMTTAQKNAIVTPAAGLVVYDTNLAKLCVYTTAWETVTSI
jgi:hypothetical protein